MTVDKKTDAWMPLWIGAYLADTQHLSRDEHGAYFLLLMAYWRNAGPLQDDDKRLAAIVKATPKEWKTLRTTMAEFFTVANGRWQQKRVDQELAAAKDRSDNSTRKAKAAAEARWGDKRKQSPPDAPSMPGALPEVVLDDCPTPTPSPTPLFTTSVAHTHNADASAPPSPTARVCWLMKQAGIADVNPGNQVLVELLKAGATNDEFQAAAEKAVENHKGFAYALGIVRKSRVEAKAMAGTIHTGPLPTTESTYQREKRENASKFAPGIAAEGPTAGAPPTEFLEITNVVAIENRRAAL